jgi:hypothetical protein
MAGDPMRPPPKRTKCIHITVAAPPPAPAPKEPEPAVDGPFLWNLVCLLLTGCLITGWVLRYTDWFEVIGGLLALGGVLSWVAVLSRWLPGHYTEKARSQFAARVLGNRWTWALALGALYVFFLFVSQRVTLQIENMSHSDKMFVVGERAVEDLHGEGERLLAGGRVRQVFPRSSPVVVQVAGFPPLRVPSNALGYRVDLRVPSSFLSPTVLIYFDNPNMKQFLTQVDVFVGTKQVAGDVDLEGGTLRLGPLGGEPDGSAQDDSWIAFQNLAKGHTELRQEKSIFTERLKPGEIVTVNVKCPGNNSILKDTFKVAEPRITTSGNIQGLVQFFRLVVDYRVAGLCPRRQSR